MTLIVNNLTNGATKMNRTQSRALAVHIANATPDRLHEMEAEPHTVFDWLASFVVGCVIMLAIVIFIQWVTL